MALSELEFPANPTLNMSVTANNNIVYVWDGEKWTSLGAITSTNVTAAVHVFTFKSYNLCMHNCYYLLKTSVFSFT